MARSNKYASLNFNDIYEKRSATATSPNSSSSQATANHSSKTVISNSRIHGHMLVLSRPTPKPIAIPQSQPGPIQHQAKSLSPTPATSLSSSPADRVRPESESDFISLRPQGRRAGRGPARSFLRLPWVLHRAQSRLCNRRCRSRTGSCRRILGPGSRAAKRSREGEAVAGRAMGTLYLSLIPTAKTAGRNPAVGMTQ